MLLLIACESSLSSISNDKRRAYSVDSMQSSTDTLGDALRRHDAVQMPPLNKPVPLNKGWIALEDDFILVYVVYLSHLSADLFYMPTSKLNDDRIYLTLIRAGATRSQLAKFLLSLESGEHMHNSPCFEVRYAFVVFK